MKFNKLLILIIFIILSISFVYGNVADDLNDNIIAYYDFETLNGAFLKDLVNNFDATINSPDSINNGIIDGAYDFTKTNTDRINTSIIIDAQGMRAINIWFNTSIIDGTSTIGGILGTSLNSVISLWAGSYSGDISGETITFIQKTVVPRELTYINNTIPAGWNMITLNWNQSSLLYEIWVNGVKPTQLQFTGGADTLIINQPLFFSSGLGGYYWDNSLDEASIFNISLTSEQIEFLYNSGSPTTNEQYPFVYTPPGAFSTTLVYPTNKTHYSLINANVSKEYNGSIIISSSVNSTCELDSYLWTAQDTFSLYHTWLNNTVILEDNYSISYSCTKNIYDYNNNIIPDNAGLYNGTLTNYVHNDGLINGATLTSSDCAYGSCYDFDGVNDYITIKDDATLDMTTGITTMAWVYSDLNATMQMILAKDDHFLSVARNVYGMMFRSESLGTFRVGVSNGTTDLNIFSTLTYTANQWYHVAMTWNATELCVYVDGTKKCTPSTISSIQTNSDQVYLGNNNDATHSYLNGKMDEFRIWNKALNETEIQAEMNSYVPIKSDGLIASLSFEKHNTTHTYDTNQYVLGEEQEAVQFDGVNNYIDFDSYTLDKDDSSLCFWFKYDGKCTNIRCSLFGDGSNTFKYLSLRTDLGILFGESDTDTDTFESPVINYDNEQFNHVCINFDNTDVDFYYNNVFIGTDTIIDDLTLSTIGLGYTASYFNGTIDEVYIFNRTLSTTEIEELYNKSYNHKFDDLPPVIYYSMNINDTYSYYDKLMSEFWFVVDNTDPLITITTPLNNSIIYDNFYVNASVFDYYLYRVNATIKRLIDNVSMYNNYSGDLPGNTTTYNILNYQNISDYNDGNYSLFIEATDTHTLKDFKEKIDKQTTLNKEKNKEDITEYKLTKGKFKITYPNDITLSEFKSKDRIHFEFKSNKFKYNYIIISADKLVYLEDSKYACHFIVNDNYWYDCEGMTSPEVIKIDDTNYMITYYHDKYNVVTDSLGGLNIVNQTIYFQVQHTIFNVSIYNSATTLSLNTTNVTIEFIRNEDNTSFINITDTGYLNYKDIQSGNYTLRITAPGFVTINLDKEILPGEINTLLLYMTPTSLTTELVYIFKSNKDATNIEGAIIKLYERINSSYVLVNTKTSDFAGSVTFNQNTDNLYYMDITATGFNNKTTSVYEPSSALSPYLIFLELIEVDDYSNIFSHISYSTSPTSNLIPLTNTLFSFIVSSDISNLNTYYITTTFNGVDYLDSSVNPNSDTLSFTLPISTSDAGKKIYMLYYIGYDGLTGNEEYSFNYTYLINPINASNNITIADTLQKLSDEMDINQVNSILNKLIITILFISALIYFFSKLGVSGWISSLLGIIFLIPAAYFGFIPNILAVMGVFVYVLYLFVQSKEDRL